MVSHRAIGCTACGIWLFMACSAANEGGGGGSGADVDVPAAGTPKPPVGTPTGTPALPGAGTGNPANGASTNEGNPIPGGITTAASNVPCDVAPIVSEHCTTCHGATPQFNAPMSLTNAQAFTAMAPISSTQQVRQAASRRINADGAARMPPPGTVDALDPTELATLTAWLDGGAAPVVEGGCSITDGSVLPGTAEELLPKPTTTGTVLAPYEGWDAGDVECYPFTSFQPGDKTAPYKVGTAVDKYMGFGFKPPWQGTRYIRAFRTIIDNTQVLHHWIFFEEPSAVDGTANEILGAHPGGAMMNGWAPGGSDMYFTPDLGMRMDSSSAYLMEVHYNSSDPNATDASGVEICVTATPPANEAIVSWLGTDAIQGTSSSGTCAPTATQPIHIVSGTPHMHLKGNHMKVVLERAAGTQEVVHDEPFSFQNQRGYPENLTIMPGDKLTTTCSYTAPSTFGKGTNEEMCYWFALAYPAGALTDNAFIGTLTHGSNACLGR
jgi:Copper type II ascorbate-dependent monooxygenase, C-terminal domain